MTRTAAAALSRDLYALAEEAGDHLREAARTTGTEAGAALERSKQALTRAAEQLRDQTEISATTTREKVVAKIHAYPVTFGVVAAAAAAAIATLTTMRLRS